MSVVLMFGEGGFTCLVTPLHDIIFSNSTVVFSCWRHQKRNSHMTRY